MLALSSWCCILVGMEDKSDKGKTVRLECYTVRVDYFDKHEVDSFPKTREGFNTAIKLAIETGFDVVHNKVMDDFKDVGDGVVWENPDNPRDMVHRTTPGWEFLASSD